MNLSPPTLEEIVLTVGLGYAVYTDLTRWKIPNQLNLILVLVAIALGVLHSTLMPVLTGITYAFILHFLLWILKVEKGGDAKLMVGLGGLVGWGEMLETTFWKLFLLVPVALVFALFRGQMRNLLNNLRMVKTATLYNKGKGMPKEEQLTYMPLAPVIACAWVIARITPWLEFWP